MSLPEAFQFHRAAFAVVRVGKRGERKKGKERKKRSCFMHPYNLVNVSARKRGEDKKLVPQMPAIFKPNSTFWRKAEREKKKGGKRRKRGDAFCGRSSPLTN